MTNNHSPLKVVSVAPKEKPEARVFKPRTNREEVQARFEREWLRTPRQFDPTRNIRETVRIERTEAFIVAEVDIAGRRVADLASGFGVIAKTLAAKDARVDAVDIAKNALEHLKGASPNITPVHDCLPATKLEDDAYDIVLCLDMIGYLRERDHRLLVNEIARLVKKEGLILFSTPIDIHSDDALENLTALLQTELDIVKWQFSYHRLHISLKNLLKAPQRFVKAAREKEYRADCLAARRSLNRLWFKGNSTKVMRPLWHLLDWCAIPLLNMLQRNRTVLTTLEKVSRLIWDTRGISHALFLAKRRPLIPAEAPPQAPIERKEKRTVWE